MLCSATPNPVPGRPGETWSPEPRSCWRVHRAGNSSAQIGSTPAPVGSRCCASQTHWLRFYSRSSSFKNCGASTQAPLRSLIGPMVGSAGTDNLLVPVSPTTTPSTPGNSFRRAISSDTTSRLPSLLVCLPNGREQAWKQQLPDDAAAPALHHSTAPPPLPPLRTARTCWPAG